MNRVEKGGNVRDVEEREKNNGYQVGNERNFV